MKEFKKRFFALIGTLVLTISLIFHGIPTLADDQYGNEQQDPDTPFSLTILHVNDSHARVEKFPQLKTAVDELRQQNTNHLLLHAGDIFSGTLYFTIFEGLADLDMMNAIGFDAAVFGNHEFDKDSATLANFVKDAEFPFVSANINFANDPILGEYFHPIIAKPEDVKNGEIYEAIIKDFNGELVAIFGLTTEDTVRIASPSEYIEFKNFIEAAKNTVNYLEELGINKIIALTHLGYNADLELASEVDGIDIIVGGHSHTELPEGVFVDKEEPTVIVQTGEYLNNLGKLEVTFDQNGVIQNFVAELIPLNNYEPDEDLAKKVEDYQKEIDELMKEVVGETTVHLDGERENVRTKETNLGNLIADGMVWKMKQFFPNTTIALQNGGGIRASIDVGDITMGEIRTVLPFDNTLVAIELTGQELYEALENSVSQYPEQNGGFLQVSGIKFKFDPEQPVGKRVWHVEVLNTEGEYEPLQLDKMYTVATNSFIAKGGDFYDSLKRAYEDGRMVNIDIPDYEVFSEYIKEFSPVSPEVEGRITVEAKPEETPDPEDPGEEPGETPGDDEKQQDPGTGTGDEDGTHDDGKGSSDDQEKTTSDSDKTDGTKEQTTKDGQKLPDTATNNYNFLLIGIALMTLGAGTFFIITRKSKKLIH